MLVYNKHTFICQLFSHTYYPFLLQMYYFVTIGIVKHYMFKVLLATDEFISESLTRP